MTEKGLGYLTCFNKLRELNISDTHVQVTRHCAVNQTDHMLTSRTHANIQDYGGDDDDDPLSATLLAGLGAEEFPQGENVNGLFRIPAADVHTLPV